MLDQLSLGNDSQFYNYLFLNAFLNIVYPLLINVSQYNIQEINLSEIKDIKSVEELFRFALKFYENRFIPKSKFRKISCILALSKSGLKKEELKDCLEIKMEMIELYIKLFKFSLLEHKSLYRSNNEIYIKTIEKVYL